MRVIGTGKREEQEVARGGMRAKQTTEGKEKAKKTKEKGSNRRRETHLLPAPGRIPGEGEEDQDGLPVKQEEEEEDSYQFITKS